MTVPGAASKLEVTLLGELTLLDDGVPVPLPASRKTRALFVYLLLCDRPVRRERLCELFFDIPDDPRAALRWSLTKIRAMLGAHADALVADRERVELRGERVVTDIARFEAGLCQPDPLALESPLAGLDLPGLPDYSAWLAGERARLACARDDLLGRAGQEAAEAADAELPILPPQQSVRFCSAPDGVRIAYACTGDGPPLVKTANWLNHLELDWTGPVWGSMIAALSRSHCLVRYDERGNGLSDWEVADLSLAAFVRDLETVADSLGLDRFPLLGISQGGAVSIEYAARHPERVSHLILLGAYAAGWRYFATPEEAATREAVITLAEHGWGQSNSVYRQLFSQTFMPSASYEELDWFNDFQRRTASPTNAVRFLRAFADIDVRHRLADVHCPTLVLHARGDQRVPIVQAIELAAAIPGASLVTLDTCNHIPLSREPATARIVECIHSFLAEPENGH